MPDDLATAARAAGLNVSQLAQRAVAQELSRRAKVAALDRYLDQLASELGPVNEVERAEAEAWADRALGPPPVRRRPA